MASRGQHNSEEEQGLQTRKSKDLQALRMTEVGTEGGMRGNHLSKFPLKVRTRFRGELILQMVHLVFWFVFTRSSGT